MPFIPPDYIDNQKVSLHTVINRLITDLAQTEAAFASGYFEPAVWRLVGSALQQLVKFRLLLGRQPEITFSQNDLVDLREYYRYKLQSDLESLQYTSTQTRLIEELIAFLRRESVEVRLFEGPFLHAKSYIFPNVAIVGSSNFTPSGLSNNAELDLVSNSGFVAKALLDEWYDPKWAQSSDYKSELIEVLEASKFGSRAWTPYEVFIKTLHVYFQGRLAPLDLASRSGLDLASFQQEGLHEAIQLLDKHRGVFIADAVGLGKTFIGLGLLEHYLIGKRRRGSIPHGLVICPAQLKNTVWEPRLRDYQIAATVLSMEELGRQDFAWKAYRNTDFVLIDESHNFRNPGTRRYRNLFRLLSTGKRTKGVALLSATPINNTVWDLYHQVLLLTKGQEDYYRDIGISNLRGFFTRVDKNEADLFDLLEETTVRRSRLDIKRRQEAGEEVVIGGKEVRFPTRELAAITYDLDGTYAGFYNAIAADIERLTLVSYNIEQFRKGTQEQTTINRNNAIIGLLKTLFLKRLESSVSAFEASVRRQQEFQKRFYTTLVERNRLLDSTAYRQLTALMEKLGGLGDEEVDNLNVTVNDLLSELPVANAKQYDLGTIETCLKTDIDIFDGLIARLDRIRQRAQSGVLHDDKLEQTKAALASQLLKKQKILVFSYYEHTARYLYESLKKDTNWQTLAGSPTLALLTGRTMATERKAILERFAPHSNINHVEQPIKQAESKEIRPSSAEIDILISTDVLSEGQNLQDAGVLLNYDLHWNPVRMIQRAGRIDRIGSPHATLLIYNCFPEAELERLLGLVGRLQSRIAAIGRNLGNDASILGEVVTEKSLEQIKRLKGCDRQILEDLEAEEGEWLGGDEMRLPLLTYLQQLGEREVERIPMGIHSGRGSQPLRGIFFAFRARDHHIWRFYEVERGALKEPPITDRRRLFRMIMCAPQEARVVPPFSIWPYLEKATQQILADLKQQQGSRRLRMPMSGLNLRLYNLLAPHRSPLPPSDGLWQESNDLEMEDEEQVVEKLLTMLQIVSFKPFERDPEMRSILNSYTSESNLDALIAELDAFAVEHELYAELNVTSPMLDAIEAEDLELICYELFS
jgi:superfamily II DNA or RNA helicase